MPAAGLYGTTPMQVGIHGQGRSQNQVDQLLETVR